MKLMLYIQPVFNQISTSNIEHIEFWLEIKIGLTSKPSVGMTPASNIG